MDTKRQVFFLKKHTADLFAFAYALTSSRKKSSELVEKAVQILYVDGMDLVENSAHSFRLSGERRMKRYLYRKIFELAKQEQPFKGSRGEYSAFYNLPLIERGILFLKHKAGLNYTELEEIFKLFRHEVISRLMVAREKAAGP